MPEESFIEKQEENISPHVFSVSAAMVGVCLTVISLINISIAIKKIDTIGDDLTAFDAVIFILSCYLSYVAMRTNNRKLRLLLEKWAGRIFLLGLFMMVLVCLFVVYKFSIPVSVSR